VLLSIGNVTVDPRDPGDDVKDGLCLLSGDAGSAGMTCASFADAVAGRLRWTIPPRGLAPDGAVTATVRVRGGRTIEVKPRNNYFDTAWVGESGAYAIAHPRFYDAQHHEIKP
jgi:hypothetical protein